VARAGERVVERDAPPDFFFFLLEGEVTTVLSVDGREEPERRHVAPTWMGAIPILTGNPWAIALRTSSGTARLAAVPAEAFTRLVLGQPSVHRRIMRTFGPTFQRVEGVTRQREKLAALGTMAAGLAHELNNPAAAARRSATELTEALDQISGTLRAFVDSGVERAEACELVRLHDEALRRHVEAPGGTGVLDDADREEAFEAWLEERGVAEPWRLAEPLAAAGLDEAWPDAVGRLAGAAAEPALRWVAASLTARGLAEDLRTSTARMSDLVGAVKAYAYMDRGALQEVDVTEGLRSTLTILGHKLKPTAIEVRTDFAADLPPVCVYGSELNQVWTNLLDNAIDALGERGTITLRAAADGPGVAVTIEDDGPGIPPDVIGRVFDPFFTTKAVGAGTGLGLDTARRIVVDRHGGDLRVQSAPGRTTFTVRLPPRPPRV
jgi:signal transduction histidine kinase